MLYKVVLRPTVTYKFGAFSVVRTEKELFLQFKALQKDLKSSIKPQKVRKYA